MEDSKIVESLKFLLSSVKKLSDSFINTEKKLTGSFDSVAGDVLDLKERIEWLENQLVDFSDGLLASARPPMTPELPVRPGSEERVVPVLNLPLQDILDVFASTPALLEPFSRPCSVSARTLGGEIEEVELEMFAQGSTWALEILGEAWMLLPKPGSLERRAQVKSLERLFEVEGVQELPATLHLLEPATALAVQHGRRWTLLQRGRLSVNPDPLRRSTAVQLEDLEQRLARLEARLG